MKLYAILLLVPFCFGGIIHPEDSSQDETSPEYDNNASEDENSSEYENRTMIPVRGIIDRPPTFPVMRNSQEQWSYVVSKIDNFNANSGTYRQRFIYNTQFAKPNGPIFVYVGGEWTIGVGSLSSGQLFEMARENGGAMFYLEHRFYGESIPTSDLSTKNLATHSSRQAIEDIRQFYNWLRTSEFYSKSKLVLMGCSYSASLSMFTKQIYPNMVTAVYATSGPLLSTFDMYQYMEVVTSYIRRVNPQCNNIIMGAIQTMESMYLNGQKDRLHQLFSVCRSSQVQEPLDRAAFFLRFIYHFANMVQSASSTVTSQCQRLTNAQGTTNLDKFVSYFAVPATQCTSGVFAHHPPGFLNTNKDQSSRSWLWQQCNEFGWFITTAGNNQVYGSSVRPSMHYALCRAVFGNAGQSDAQLNAKVTATNSNYNVNPGKGAGLKNIAFLYSSDDPWAPMGYNMLPNSQTRMLRIEGGGHCADMSSSSASDSASMRNAKNTARALIKQWLQ